MASIVTLPEPLPTFANSPEFIREYEVVYYTILKGDRATQKLTKLSTFETVTPTTEITEQDVPLYSEKSPRKIQTSVAKSFTSDGYLTKEELAQELIDIVDMSKLSNADTEYPIYRVLLYKPLEGDDKNVYLAHKYTTNVTVSHIAPKGRLLAYNVVFNVRGDMELSAIDTSEIEPTIIKN